MYDVEKIRLDFPNLSLEVNGHPNTFLDTAASAQKPQEVIDKIVRTYIYDYANVHRGSYHFSEQATAEYEKARGIVRQFINAKSENEIVFIRSATEGINLVAASWGMNNLHAGDEILLSEAEHHANLVPWQNVRDKTGCTLKYFKINDDGSFNEDSFYQMLNPKVKLVAVTAMSNVLGTVFPVKEIANAAHLAGALCLVDACQSAVHAKTDVQDIDCDFLAFSGHKLYGPTGIGCLYAKYGLLASMQPYQFGGDMIEDVSYEKTTFTVPPARFEAGTPAIVQAIGLGAALNYMQKLGMENIEAHERSLVRYAEERLSDIKDLKIIGTAPNKGGVFSFALGNIHPQDVAFILDKEGVAIRTGHHCAQPLVNRMGYSSLARASFGLYTNRADIDRFAAALEKTKTFF
uniref:Cysteine desulfurase n=1 Tax=uncultured Alphaproteobacteria bacterium TaxID=91750 RepID=A0A6G8F393_9PROT|nr:cysteine desulfurase [uncultured Alphaproteobacteria bacterium]